MLKTKKFWLIAIPIFFIAFVVPILDTYVFENEGFDQWSSGIALLLIFAIPVIAIGGVALGLLDITRRLASSKVSSDEKKGMLKRLGIVIAIISVVILLLNSAQIIDALS